MSWALESGESEVALLEAGGGPGSGPRYTLVGIGAVKQVRERSHGLAYTRLESLIKGLECRGIPCREMAFVALGYESVAGEEPWLESLLGYHAWPSLVAFVPERLAIYDRLAGRTVICPRGSWPGRGSKPEELPFSLEGPSYSTPRSDFMGWVGEAKRAIEDGEAFQVVISRLLRYRYSGHMYKAYSRLARINPSPYMYYFKVGELEIIGSSPELLVRMDEGVLETRPIAGTRPRGRGSREDMLLEEEMLSSEKERAEHLMLVDLARNDLGRVSVPGSVRVVSLMDVEKFSHVQHMVSRVISLALPRSSYADVLRSVMPAGTVSGAPKARAMELIARLEDSPRGPYAGAIGVAARRAGETAIIIRSAWSVEGEVEVRAGAGIVYDSTPEREFMETEHKLAALKEALGA